jgi:hypothetical protein
MGAAFLYRDWVPSAAFVGDIGTPPIASLPLSNLLDAQPRVRTRWIPAEASLYFDFGTAREVACVALIATTFGTTFGFPIGPSVRVRVGPDAGFGASDWDSGFVPVDTATQWNGNIVILHASSVTARYMRVDIDNSTDTYLDIGRIVAGPLWRVRYNVAYGAAEGRLILDRRERNGHTGAEFAVPATNNPRMATFTLPLLAAAEVTGEWRQMQDTLGAVGDTLWIPDTEATQAELNARAVFGAVQRPGESLVTRANFAGSTRTFSIVERV